ELFESAASASSAIRISSRRCRVIEVCQKGARSESTAVSGHNHEINLQFVFYLHRAACCAHLSNAKSGLLNSGLSSVGMAIDMNLGQHRIRLPLQSKVADHRPPALPDFLNRGGLEAAQRKCGALEHVVLH